jgi:hypothetical protein
MGLFIVSMCLLLLMLVSASTPHSPYACEPTLAPPGYIPPTPIPIETQVAYVIDGAQIVLDGTVVSWTEGSGMDSILTVQVEQYLKGHGPKTVKISGYFWICAPNFAFSQGSRAIFFVNGDPASTEPLQVLTWYDSQEAVVASVKNSTGQTPRAPDGTYTALWLGLLACFVLGWFLLLRYRRTRSERDVHQQQNPEG